VPGEVDHLEGGQPWLEFRYVGADGERCAGYRQIDGAPVDAAQPGQDRQQRGLAGAVRAD
jgi:hypothetical protein